ncbi:hypothetical protein [Streptomyces sp. UNOC14_S4]|uniref:hypothetical protein n=1 Tax=Streptomyces sp. UNOC14_S4 TaxID=2872340 RepID=UPI001E322C33|nr:hypothetical protein [Streptomyces sp. UNOC14_S4]MCC3769701.1 hypothetical protein [Streptomyces sp. UNOC14_S4]
MTQSGQGNAPRPPAQIPREGVVLPAQQETQRWDAEAAAPAPEPGRPWGQPWGPDAQRVPLPPEMPAGNPAGNPGSNPGGHLAGNSEATQYLPPVLGGAAAGPGAQDSASAATQYLPPVGDGPVPGAPLPPAPYAQPGMSGMHGGMPGGIPGAGDATQLLPPQTGGPELPQYLAPVDHGQDSAAATQYLPPVTDGPPVPSATTDAVATQYLPPVMDGRGGGAGEAATQYLPPVPPAGHGQMPVPSAAVPPGPVPPVSAPPHIPPAGAPFAQTGERPTPAEFDGLFRESAAAAVASASATDRIQGFPQPGQGHGQAPPRGPQAGAPRPPQPQPQSRSERSATSRKKKLPTPAVVGIVVAACAAAGLGAGALLSGGGDGGGDEKKSDQQNTAASSAAPGSEAKPDDGKTNASPKADDPVLAQAKALDALLKDSNNSRDAVVKAVDSTRKCKDLGKSASDLRDAAKQRDDLLTRLQQTTIDKLPNSAALSAQLTKAWQSSSSADSHYATWADQAGAKGGCEKNRPKPTADSTAGDKASDDATAAKKQAADLWNPIAKQYHLSQHKWTQL